MMAGLGNRLRVATGQVVVGVLYYPWRVCEKVLRRPLGSATHGHQVVREALRLFGDPWPVQVRYRNAVDPHQALRFKLDLCRATQLWHFRTAGQQDGRWMRILADALPQAECFVDVGAHLGIYAMTMAQIYPKQRIVAIEPEPDNYALLRAHLAMNGLERVESHACAIASTGGEAVYYRNPLNDGGGGLTPRAEYRSGDRRVDAVSYQRRHPDFQPTVRVPCRRLDELVETPCVMKIDVEGSELNVLHSAEKLLRDERVRVIVLEVWEEHFDAAIHYLQRWQMDCFRQGSTVPLRVGDRCGRRIVELLCLHRRLPTYRAIVGRLV